MVRIGAVVVIAVGWLTACGGFAGYPNVPVPDDAENPIVIGFSGGTPADAVPIISQVLSEIPISTSRVDPGRGYVETRWFDIAMHDPVDASGYPLRERQVLYAFQAADTEGGRKEIELTAYGPAGPHRPATRATIGSSRPIIPGISWRCS